MGGVSKAPGRVVDIDPRTAFGPDFTNITGGPDVDWLSTGIAETITVDLKKICPRPSADDEVFFSQKGPIGSPQLDFPVACTFWADGIAAERPIPTAWTRGHTKPPDLMHAFAAVPAMLHRRIHIRQQSRVEDVRSGFGSPVTGAHCQSGDPVFSRALHN